MNDTTFSKRLTLITALVVTATLTIMAWQEFGIGAAARMLLVFGLLSFVAIKAE